MMLSLSRKWRTFSADPSAVLEYRITTPMRWRVRELLKPLRNALGRYWLRDTGVMEAVAAFNQKRPAYSFDPDWLDLWGLYSDIRQRKPRRVLEYGSGVSTIVMSHALYQNGAGKLTSLESESEWATINREALATKLRPFCELLHVPAVPVLADRAEAWRFACAPVPNPDYVYIDGPPGVEGRVITVDPLDLDLAAGARIVIDGRTTTKPFLIDRLPSSFRSRYRNLLPNDTIIDLQRK